MGQHTNEDPINKFDQLVGGGSGKEHSKALG